MRETRSSGSEGGGSEHNRFSLPLSRRASADLSAGASAKVEGRKARRGARLRWSGIVRRDQLRRGRAVARLFDAREGGGPHAHQIMLTVCP
jgi:hypothetical protein